MAVASLILGAFGGFGKKTQVPGFNPIDASAVQQQTIAGNLAAQSGANSIAANANQFSLEQFQKALDFLAPGAVGQARTNIADQLRGVVSPEDTRTTLRNASAAGFQLGVGGNRSGFGQVLSANRLFKDQQATKQQGFQNLLALTSRMPAQFDPSSMFLTPSQRLAQATSERDDTFKRDLLANQIDAAPDPFLGGLTQMDVGVTKSL